MYKSKINAMVEEDLPYMEKVSPADLGFESNRVDTEIWVYSSGFIIKLNADHQASYYWGLEYVEEENREVLGDYVRYSFYDDYLAGNYQFYKNI